jgi:uncharacterized membrane protein YgcG
MPPNSPHRALIVRFLGQPAADHGAFGLLGIGPEDCTPARIDLALQSRLDQLLRHVDGESSEADQVRLLLHKAAQQLLDPAVRIALAQHVQSGRDSDQTDIGLETQEQDGRQEQARQSVGRYGTDAVDSAGWGRHQLGGGAEADIERYEQRKARARERLAIAVIGIAGVSVLALFFTLLVLVWPKPGSNAAASGQAQAGAGGSGAAGGAGPGTGALVGANGATTPSPGQAGQTVSAQTTQSGPGPSATERTGSAVASSSEQPILAPLSELPTPPQSKFMESTLLIKRLRDASKLAATDPEASLRAFIEQHQSLRDWWCDYDPGANRAATESAVQLIFALARAPGGVGGSGSETDRPGRRALDAVTADARRLVERRPENVGVMPPDEIARAVWSVAFLSRLSRERDLDPVLSARLGGVLNEVLGAGRPMADLTFEAGGLAALAQVPGLLLKTPAARLNSPTDQTGKAFERWLVCLDALTPAGSEEAEDRELEALEAVLLNPRDPTDDVAVYEAMQVLTVRIKWRSGSNARARLLAWFRDERVSNADLRVVTSLLASKSNAEGVDGTMILSVAATSDDRAQVRARFAKAWGLASSDVRERAMTEWAARVDEALGEKPAGTDPEVRLWTAAKFARLNEAALAIWSGDPEAATRLLSQREPDVPESFVAPARAGSSGGSGGGGGGGFRGSGGSGGGAPTASGSWAERYLAAERSIPLRLARLKDLDEAQRPLSSVDAQVLIDSACFGVPYQVQQAAQRLVAKDVNDTAVLGAMLEIMPRTPKTRSVSDTIERLTLGKLPPVTDPQWDVAARRALLGRLLGLLAVSSTEAWQEVLSRRIADSYLHAVKEESSGSAAAEDALRGVQLLHKRWREQAEKSAFNPTWPLTLQQINRRAQGRRSLAVGPVQVFAAEQTSLVETMAYAVSAERSGRSVTAQQIMSELAQSRRSASHVYEQILASERAIARLWRLRLQEQGVAP